MKYLFILTGSCREGKIIQEKEKGRKEHSCLMA